jgi:hypothetical protein
LIRQYDLLTRQYDLLTRQYDLLTRQYDLLIRQCWLLILCPPPCRQIMAVVRLVLVVVLAPCLLLFLNRNQDLL